MNDERAAGVLNARDTGVARIGIGLAQGVGLYALSLASGDKGWLAHQTLALSILVVLLGFVPVLLLGGVGQMRPGPLLVWAALAGALLAGLEWHDVARVSGDNSALTRSTPSLGFLSFGALTLFIAHHLVAAADQERRPIAAYPRYFELAWTSAIQIVLAVAFTSVFWAILWLGAALLNLIGIGLLKTLLEQTWFSIPATTVAFAAAIHATDRRAALVRGARALVLALFSWLMPVMTALAVAFVVLLPFTGLKALWATRQTTPIVLSSAIVLTALVNAAYQDGGADRAQSKVLQIAGRLGGACLLPLTLIGAYSTLLRIGQYGLTPERVTAVACLLVALVYAVGYLLDLAPRLGAQKLFERTNVAAAMFCIGVFLALFSPLADPARLAVNDQVARLRDGRIAPDKFDFRFLRYDSMRYGREAFAGLKDLKEGRNAAAIAAAARRAEQDDFAVKVNRPDTGLPNVRVFPEGRHLPPAFAGRDWRTSPVDGLASSCLTDSTALCDAYLVDIDHNGVEDILLTATGWTVGGKQSDDQFSDVDVFQLSGRDWSRTGLLPAVCDEAMRKALREGKVEIKPAATFDLLADGRALPFRPADRDQTLRCRKR